MKGGAKERRQRPRHLKLPPKPTDPLHVPVQMQREEFTPPVSGDAATLLLSLRFGEKEKRGGVDEKRGKGVAHLQSDKLDPKGRVVNSENFTGYSQKHVSSVGKERNKQFVKKNLQNRRKGGSASGLVETKDKGKKTARPKITTKVQHKQKGKRTRRKSTDGRIPSKRIYTMKNVGLPSNKSREMILPSEIPPEASRIPICPKLADLRNGPRIQSMTPPLNPSPSWQIGTNFAKGSSKNAGLNQPIDGNDNYRRPTGRLFRPLRNLQPEYELLQHPPTPKQEAVQNSNSASVPIRPSDPTLGRFHERPMKKVPVAPEYPRIESERAAMRYGSVYRNENKLKRKRGVGSIMHTPGAPVPQPASQMMKRVKRENEAPIPPSTAFTGLTKKQISDRTCAECGKVFTASGSLTRHMLTHRDERPFPCEICSRRFRQRAHLKKHIRVHTGEKPYSCPYCPWNFTQKSSLTGHIRTKHTFETPYQCPDCDKKFPTRNHLRAHKPKCNMPPQPLPQQTIQSLTAVPVAGSRYIPQPYVSSHSRNVPVCEVVGINSALAFSNRNL